MRNVKAEIRLVAFNRDKAGLLSVIDIVETSRHHAPFFMRRFYRDREVYAVASAKMIACCEAGTLSQPRVINR